MKREDDRQSISILEAMDNLSSMSELDEGGSQSAKR